MSPFYDLLLQALQCAAGGDPKGCYQLLGIVLNRFVDTALADTPVQFGGLFTKVDYLVQQHHMPRELSRALSALRQRLRRGETSQPRTDIAVLADFISRATGDTPPAELAGDVPPSAHAGALPPSARPQGGKGATSPAPLVMKAIVDTVTTTAFTCHNDDYAELTVNPNDDQRHLLSILHEGDIVNIVQYYFKEHRAVHVIYQPDYLVNVSTIAAAFQPNANSPYNALLQQLQPYVRNKYNILGDIASAILDDEVRGKRSEYRDIVAHYFRQHTLDILAATGVDAELHQQAQLQQQNIRRALAAKDIFHKEQAVLEPSFFCEALGIQGRMDLLQTDAHLIIEQKSGKCGFPQRDPDTPELAEPHYVQTLLYLAMMRYGHGIPNDDIRCFLLYSKYRNSLLATGPAPALLAKALRLRNQIVYLQMQYARTDRVRHVLLGLTPEALCTQRVAPRLWNDFLRPKIAEVLDTIQHATPTEQAYFFRFFRFVALEQLYAKLGTNAKEGSGFAAKWYATLADKLLTGDILHGLYLTEAHTDDAGDIVSLLLVRGDVAQAGDVPPSAPCGLAEGGKAPACAEGGTSPAPLNFRTGDIVVLYTYTDGTAPDVRKAMVHRGAIQDITPSTVTVRLRAPQSSTWVFRTMSHQRWAIEHDLVETTFNAQYRGLFAFLTAPQERKDLLLAPVAQATSIKSVEAPATDRPLLTPHPPLLNLIIGPPGTGKTSHALIERLKQQFADKPHSAVLLMAYTNRAVDEICDNLLQHHFDFIRIAHPINVDEQYHPYLLDTRLADIASSDDAGRVLAQADIIVGTTTTLTTASTALFTLRTYDLAIIDEASQILEPQLLTLLASPAIRRFILIGDEKQLPAVVQQSQQESATDDPLLHAIGLRNCRNSLFERMLQRVPKDCIQFLARQGRMHPDIAQFPNEAFYGGRLAPVGLPHQTDTSAERPRLHFIPVPRPEHTTSDKVNADEARVIAREALAAYQAAPDDTIGVIVPYRSQIATVRAALPPQLRDITIDTVERYQGSQRDTIIYGFTVQYPYQLTFLTSATYTDPTTGALIDRRLNVALTRARKHEVIVGNPEILRQSPVLARLIDYLQNGNSSTRK